MKNLPLLLGSLLFTLVAVVGVAFLFTNKSIEEQKPQDPQVLVSDTPNVKGENKAGITLVEFSDFQCPACGAVQPLVKEVLTTYGEQISFVYRHFPLRSIHKHAALAARASEAAGKQQSFFAYHDLLFDRQAQWSNLDDPTSFFVELARELKLNEAQFKLDLADATLDSRIVTDERDGGIVGVSATPSFFVNGVKTDSQKLMSAVAAMLATK